MSHLEPSSQELIARLRRDYSAQTLSEHDTPSSPFDLLSRWIDQAMNSSLVEPNAMALSTISPDGWPQSRIVLLREVSPLGLIFYTNYHSAKGQAIAANARASVLFFWDVLERQIRVQGVCRMVDESVSDTYFASRPRDSQIGAWASAQSQVLGSRDELEDAVRQISERFEGIEVPRPPFWGGYVVEPVTIEFWQGRPSRLHDRLRYTLSGEQWHKERLSP